MIYSLDFDIKSFTEQRKDLLRSCLDKFVIFYNGKLQGAYDSFDAAAESAVQRFGQGPYLIRQVIRGNNNTSSIPASIAYRIF